MASKEPRIVNVSSFGHNFCPILYDDPGFSKGAVYDKWNAYGQAKTANILFSRELANRYGDKGLSAFSLHPGAIMTPLAKHINVNDEFTLEKMVDYQGNTMPMPADFMVFKTIQQGTSTHIVAAFDPSIKTQNGSYLQDARIDNDSVRDWAKDDQNASRLWELSEKLVGYSFKL
jgi:NAD(P)-dependent dehydrogenase (short-subunit alcohol dehydrogenase family)